MLHQTLENWIDLFEWNYTILLVTCSAWLWDQTSTDGLIPTISKRIELITGLSTQYREIFSSAEPFQVRPFIMFKICQIVVEWGRGGRGITTQKISWINFKNLVRISTQINHCTFYLMALNCQIFGRILRYDSTDSAATDTKYTRHTSLKPISKHSFSISFTGCQLWNGRPVRTACRLLWGMHNLTNLTI